ncbi:hypothetical protein BJ742DRAFT_657477, partial [Cladochytrium replicatum]
ASKLFHNPKLDYPKASTAKSSKRFVRNMKPLHKLITPVDEVSKILLDLIARMLMYDPAMQITAKEALARLYFKVAIPDDG